MQWRVVRQIEASLEAWNSCEPVTADAMGRSAAKVEDIEAAISKLSLFEHEASAAFETSNFESSGSSRPVARRASFFSPGLQRAFAGKVCGFLPGREMVAAKAIEADRLEFRGEPVFDPTPFLDPLGQKIFNSPLQMAKDPCELTEPVPAVRIFASEEEKWALLRKLDASGRLGVVKSRDVLPGFQAGLFSVLKDGVRDRLIFDSRPFNCLETAPRRWIKSMAHACNLCDLHLLPTEDFIVSGTDLREFYYSFACSEERVIRNALLVSVWGWQLKGFRCYDPSLEAETKPVFLGLQTLAMGDTQAVELAQTAHVGLLYQKGLLSPEALLSMNMPIPRNPLMLGVIIDDLIIFEKVARGSNMDFSGSSSCQLLDQAVVEYTEVGLLPHPGKTFHGLTKAEFWGSLFEGDRGFVRAPLKRVVPVVFATLGVVKLGVCTVSLLEVLVGCWNSIFLFRRRLLSLFNVCYEALQRGEDRRSVIRLSPELKTELLLFVNLAPVAATCLRTRDSSVLYASDASSWGWAICSAELPPVLRSEVHRRKLTKPVWSKLLSPLKRCQRLKGSLPPAAELPEGVTLPTNPLFMDLACSLPFRVEKKKGVRDVVHINITELRSMVETEKLAAFREFPGRTMSLSDSQVALGCWIKGRSSSVGLNQELQQSLPVHLGCGMTSNGAYIPSELNPADDPTRHVIIREPSKALPAWLGLVEESLALHGCCDWTSLDAWLDSYGFSSESLSGLPPFSELDGLWNEPPWSRNDRHRLFLLRQKPFLKAKSKPSSASVELEFGKTLNSSSAPVPPCAESLGKAQLSTAAVEVLKRVPFSQFLFPKDWHVADILAP